MYSNQSTATRDDAGTSSSGPAPGKRSLTASLPAKPGARTDGAAAPPEVLARVGAEFVHTDDTSGKRSYRVSAGGGFVLTAAFDGRGVGTEFRADNKFHAAWNTLVGYVLAHQDSIAPTVRPAAPTAAAGPPVDPWSLEGIAAAVGDGLSRAGDAVQGAIDRGSAFIDRGVALIDELIGTVAPPAPAETKAPARDDATAPTVDPTAPAAPATHTDADIPAMSQFKWYGYAGEALTVDAALAGAQFIASTFGFGGSPTLVTEPAAAVKKKNGNHGYFWFDAGGKPVRSGESGGTQYFIFTIGDGQTSSRANPLTEYLSAAAPGQRAPTVTVNKTKYDATPELQNLNLRNIPGYRSCFNTTISMMLAGGQKTSGEAVSGIISSEAFNDDDARTVKSVTIDAPRMAEAKAYLDFEAGAGRPVMIGVDYKDHKDKINEGITDHWVICTGADGKTYRYNDPADGTAGNTLTWDGEKIFKVSNKGGTALKVLSFVKFNQASLSDWHAHWAAQQQG